MGSQPGNRGSMGNNQPYTGSYGARQKQYQSDLANYRAPTTTAKPLSAPQLANNQAAFSYRPPGQDLGPALPKPGVMPTAPGRSNNLLGLIQRMNSIGGGGFGQGGGTGYERR
jgi:hypothetical protein